MLLKCVHCCVWERTGDDLLCNACRKLPVWIRMVKELSRAVQRHGGFDDRQFVRMFERMVERHEKPTYGQREALSLLWDEICGS
jgi:hypothetical protein